MYFLWENEHGFTHVSMQYRIPIWFLNKKQFCRNFSLFWIYRREIRLRYATFYKVLYSHPNQTTNLPHPPDYSGVCQVGMPYPISPCMLVTAPNSCVPLPSKSNNQPATPTHLTTVECAKGTYFPLLLVAECLWYHQPLAGCHSFTVKFIESTMYLATVRGAYASWS